MKIKNFFEEVRKLKGFVGGNGNVSYKGFAGSIATVSMEFTGKEADPSETGGRTGKYLTLRASNGTAQATILCLYEGDETGTYIVGSKLLETAEILSGFGDEIEITHDENANALRISCGDATVLQEICKDTMSLKRESVKEALHLTVKAKDLAELVTRGGFATGDASTSVQLFKGTIVLFPCEEGENAYFRAVSVCDAFLATALAEVGVKDMTTFTKATTEGKTAVVNVTALSALAKRLVSDEVDLFIGNKQVLVRDGLDTYLFNTVDGAVPPQIIEYVTNKVQEEFSCTLEGSTLKKVLQVAALSGEKKVYLSFAENLLSISANKSKAALPTVGGPEEEKTFPYDVNVLKEVVSSMPSELRVYSPKGAAGLFLEGTNCKAYVLPMKE